MPRTFLEFHEPKTVGQWLIFSAAIGITLTSPVGTRAFFKELRRYLREKQEGHKKEYETRQLSQTLYYLKKRKLIKIKELNNGEIKIELTEKGHKRKLQYDFENLKIKDGGEWDGKWRILMFDIPEQKRPARESLRDKLKKLGFVQFQRSVWLYPYPCENEIDFITEYYSIAKYANLITVDIKDDKPLRVKFKL